MKYELMYASLTNWGTPFNAAPYGVRGVLLAELLAETEPVMIACGDWLRGWLFARGAMPARRARFEVFPGKTADQVNGFAAAARIYER